MPVYVFRCTACRSEAEVLLPLGDTAVRPCPACGADMHHRLGRVAVKYDAFGFTATDRLVPNSRGKDLRALRSKAEEIADS